MRIIYSIPQTYAEKRFWLITVICDVSMLQTKNLNSVPFVCRRSHQCWITLSGGGSIFWMRVWVNIGDWTSFTNLQPFQDDRKIVAIGEQRNYPCVRGFQLESAQKFRGGGRLGETQGGAAKKKSDMGSKFFLRTKQVGLTNYCVNISPYMVISRDPLALDTPDTTFEL